TRVVTLIPMDSNDILDQIINPDLLAYSKAARNEVGSERIRKTVGVIFPETEHQIAIVPANVPCQTAPAGIGVLAHAHHEVDVWIGFDRLDQREVALVDCCIDSLLCPRSTDHRATCGGGSGRRTACQLYPPPPLLHTHSTSTLLIRHDF